MRTYGQYCPISRASELLAERWTMLVVRNLLLGCTTFNDIAAGVPGMSRTLLSARLRALADAGVIEVSPRRGRRGHSYTPTDAGRALWDVVMAMSAWGERFIELQSEHSDPSFVLWAWVHVHLRRDRLPARVVVVQFDFPDQRPPHHRFWVRFGAGEAELCHAPPADDAKLFVRARSVAFTRWHVGGLAWREALRDGSIAVDGPRALARALPSWNGRALPGQAG